jgi:hypothetical protein
MVTEFGLADANGAGAERNSGSNFFDASLLLDPRAAPLNQNHQNKNKEHSGNDPDD